MRSRSPAQWRWALLAVLMFMSEHLQGGEEDALPPCVLSPRVLVVTRVHLVVLKCRISAAAAVRLRSRSIIGRPCSQA
jgi:hypothetical protein